MKYHLAGEDILNQKFSLPSYQWVHEYLTVVMPTMGELRRKEGKKEKKETKEKRRGY